MPRGAAALTVTCWLRAAMMPPAMVAAPLGLGGGGGEGGRGGCGGLERAIMRTVVAASAITVGGIAASAAGGGPCCGWTRAREVRPRHLVCSLSTRHWHCVTRSQPRCGRRHRFEQCYIVRIYRLTHVILEVKR